MKRLFMMFFLIVTLAVIGCGRRRSDINTRYYPTMGWETLKMISVLNTIDQHFESGVHTHVVLRPEEVPTLTSARTRKNWSMVIKKPFRPIRIRHYYTWDHVHNIQVYGPNIQQQVSVSGYGDLISVNTGTPLNYSPFGYLNITSVLGFPYSIQPGASIHVDGVFYPKSVGFGDGTKRSAPLSIAYYPDGEFVGFIPGYAVIAGGSNHIPRLKEDVGGNLVTLDNLRERLKIYGGLDHVKGKQGLVTGFIEHDKLRYGSFTLTNLYDEESELTYEIFIQPQPI